MRGWLASIRRVKSPNAEIYGYENPRTLFRFFHPWEILAWDAPAVTVYSEFKSVRPRVGAMDLKIASICRANSATLLTRNTKDFVDLPGLAVEDWL